MARGYGSRRGGSGSDGVAKGQLMHPYTKQTRTTSPEACDKSTVLKGPSVNAEATRKSTQPYQRTLGPRTA